MRVDVGRRNEHARHPGFDQLGIPADPRRDDGESAGHRLEDRVGDALRERRQDEAVESAHDLRHVGALACEPDAIAHPGALQQLPHLAAQRAFADE